MRERISFKKFYASQWGVEDFVVDGYVVQIPNRSAKTSVLDSPIFFGAQHRTADWGWGFIKPQPLPNPPFCVAIGNFQLAKQKKETKVSLRLTNFVLS